MKECGIWAKEVVMGCSPKDAEIISKVIGSTIKEKGKDLTSSLKRIKYLWGSGSMMLQKLEFTHRLKTLPPSKFKEKSISLIPTFCQPSTKSDSKTQPLCLNSLLKK